MMSDLIVINKENALEVFTGEKLDDFLKQIEDDAMNFVPDISTDKGRKQIASKAHTIAKEKTAIDKVGKELVADWKNKAALVDQSRKKSREFLEDLKDRVRKPLTTWEAEDLARITAEEELKELLEAWEDALKEDELFDRQKEVERKLKKEKPTSRQDSSAKRK